MSLATITSGGDSLASVADECLQVRIKTEFEQAVEDGLAFSWSNLTKNIDATDTALCVQNDSTIYDLYIERILVSTDASGQIVVHTSSGVTMAGDAVTGVNLNRNSSTTAPATCKGDESGNGQAGASYSGRLYTVYALANQGIDIPVHGAIVLPYNHNIGIDITAEPTGSAQTIIGYFKART